MGVRGINIAKWMYRNYPTAKVDKLLPRIPYEIPNKQIKVRGGNLALRAIYGKQMRLQTIAKSVNKLVRDERIELSYYKAYEVRNYTERLIMDAIRYGDCHLPTMEVANFYLSDKELIHKLFKVLVPRYLHYSEAFTAMHLLSTNVKACLGPKGGKSIHFQQAVLELKGNPFPNVRNETIDSKNFLTNVLLRAAKEEYYKEKDKNVNK